MREIANSRYLDNSKVVCIIDDDLKRLESIYEALRLLEQGSVLRNMQDTMR